MSLSRHRRLRANNSSAIVVAPALPSALSGLVAWGEGSDLGTDGSQIASWLNKTGSGLDPAQATAGNRPTVKANAINGQKAALFTAASNQGLIFPAGALSWFQNVAGATFAAVLQPVTTAATAQVVSASRNTDAANRLALIVNTTPKLSCAVRSDDSTNSTILSAASLSNGTPYIAAIAADARNGVGYNILNGVSVSGAISPAQNFPNTASSGIGIGSRSDLTALFDGYIAAYAMWNVAYSASQLRGVLLRWSQLYGIALA